VQHGAILCLIHPLPCRHPPECLGDTRTSSNLMQFGQHAVSYRLTGPVNDEVRYLGPVANGPIDIRGENLAEMSGIWANRKSGLVLHLGDTTECLTCP
jgi:hypothetical protein